MPLYSYTAKSLAGETKTGKESAKSKRDLASILRAQGLILISANEPEKSNNKKKGLLDFFSFLTRVSLEEKMFFTRNLGVMIGAGTPLPRALKMLAEQVKSKRFKNALIKISEEISKGIALSKALASHPKIFSELFRSMVKVGEESGTLEDNLKVLTRQMEREHELSSKVKSAMVYPVVIVVAMLGIGVLMLILVVPKLADTFDELGIDLPPTTKFVIGVGMFLSRFWYLIPLIILVLAAIIKVAVSTKQGKKLIDTLFLKAPIIAPIVKKTNSAHTARTLSSLITSGVPIVRSLEIISNSLTNIHFKNAIAQTAAKVRKGSGLAESLKPHTNIYPQLFVQMIAVGEETGETSAILGKLADFFEEEVTSATKNLAAVIEPVLMIIIGAAVGFFAVSMIQPMYSMLGTI